jgi:hypothetical protein
VSRTISRISPQHFDDSRELTQRIAFSEARIDNEIGPPALFPVRGLLPQDRAEFLRRHARPRKDAGSLKEGRRGDDEDGIAPPLAAAFEEKGNVEDDDRRPAQPLPPQEALRILTDQRMDDLLEAAERIRIAEDPLTEETPIDGTGDDGAGKGRVHGTHRAAAASEETVHRGVGIVHGHAEPTKRFCGRAFPHADRASEAEDLQSVASIACRNSAVTFGSTPNQTANPGRP